MIRREFISLLTSAAMWPLGARAKQPAMPVVGFLNGTSPEGYGIFLSAFRQGLSETGYVDGRNVINQRGSSIMRRALAFSIVLKAALSASGADAETLKVAVAQRGFWNEPSSSSASSRASSSRKRPRHRDPLYRRRRLDAHPVIAGSIDIAMTNGTLGAIAAYAKGMPVRII